MLARRIDALRQRACAASPAVDERERIKGIDQVANLDVGSSRVEARRVTRPSISNCYLVHRLQLG